MLSMESFSPGMEGAYPLPPPPQAPRSRSEIEMGKVFVGGLARETTTEGLRGYFERFGDISDCVVMKDRATGLPRGFGLPARRSACTLAIDAAHLNAPARAVNCKRIACGHVAPLRDTRCAADNHGGSD